METKLLLAKNGIVRKATKTAIVATLTATRYVVIPEAFKWLQSQICRVVRRITWVVCGAILKNAKHGKRGEKFFKFTKHDYSFISMSNQNSVAS
jgi:hypothetical protein